VTPTSPTRSGVLALGVACVLALSVVAVGPAAADGGQTYHVQQGDRCIEVTPIAGDGDATSFYGHDGYRSLGTQELQRPDTSSLLLHEAPDGTVSLVVVHDEVEADGSGGAASFEFENMPRTGIWTVRDDADGVDVGPNPDAWHTDGLNHTVDWSWNPGWTDGGVYGPLGDSPDVRITPRFNDEATFTADFGGGTVDSWQLLDGNQSGVDRHTLSMDQPVRLRRGPCPDESADRGEVVFPVHGIEASSINRTTVPVGEPVSVTVTVQNYADVNREYTSRLKADFDVVGRDVVPLPASATRNVTHVFSLEETGTYHVRDGTDYLGEIEVTPTPTPDIDAARTGNGTVAVTALNASYATALATAVPEPNGTAPVAVETLNLTADTDRLAFEMASLDTLGNASTPAPRQETDTVGYLRVGGNDTDAVSHAAMTLAVDRDGTAPDALSVRRYNRSADAWERLDATRLASNGSTVRLRVDTDSLGTFAVAERAGGTNATADRTQGTGEERGG